MKKLLICGASGFIGRNLFEHLSKRSDLDVYGTYLTRRFQESAKLIRADLTDREWARTVTRGMDFVINAAAVTDGSGAVASDPDKYITDNIRINMNLIESAHTNYVSHFTFLSCSVVYPANNAELVKEVDVDVNKIHPKYTGAKLVKLHGEDLCNFYASLGRTRYTVVRHSNVYGPYDKFDSARGHVFAATVTKIMTAADNETVIIWGEGREKRDFLHVSDLIRFFELILNHGNRYDVLNAGSGKTLTVRELVNKINLISGRNLPIRYEASRPSIDTDIILDTTKAREALDWQPDVDIDEGIRQTIDWYLKNKGERNGK